MNREFLELIKTRRSCRKYKPEQITDEELQAVLEAGTYAPTSRGMQSPLLWQCRILLCANNWQP